jgi:predicted GH43/DUF377 family glycosyl hydrolase
MWIEELRRELYGRQLDIWRGHDGDGRPIDLTPEMRQQYLDRWRGLPEPTAAPKRQTTPRPASTQGPPPRKCGSCGKKKFGNVEPQVARLPDTITVNHGANGLGDAVLGMVAVLGLSLDDPGKRIVYKVHADAVPFVELFSCGAERLGVHDVESTPARPRNDDLQINVGYGTECKSKGSTPRWERYRSNIGASKCVLPELKDREKLVELGKEYQGCVVISPLSSYRDREYSQRHWLEVVDVLKAKGYRPIVLSHTPDRTDVFGCERVIGEPAEVVAGILLNAVATVGNDSGIAHLAGAMGCPAVVLCGQTTGESIFGFYPRVRVLQGHLSCNGCWWQAPHSNATCGNSCPSLQTISPAEVVRAVDDFALPVVTAGRSCVPLERLGVIRDLVLATNHLPGDLAEVGVWRGGTAKLLERYGTHGAVHLFDTFTGIPETDQLPGGHVRGDFDDTRLDDVKEFLTSANVFFHVGIFPETAITAPGQKYRFAHLDADTYQSTKAAIEYFRPRMVAGGKILFDDYGWRRCPGVQRAYHELLGEDMTRMSEYQVVWTAPASAPTDLLPPVSRTRVRLDGEKRYNPGLVRFGGKILLAVREGWYPSRVAIYELDDSYQPIRRVPVEFDPAVAWASQEDPRLFLYQGRLYMSFTACRCGPDYHFCGMRYCELNSDYQPVEVFEPKHPSFGPEEKNWQFFQQGDDLCFVYSISPHKVFKVHGSEVLEVFETPNVLPWSGGKLRGGTPPVRIGDEFVSFFHGVEGEGVDRRYNAGVYAFETRPPFRVTRMSAEPLVRAPVDYRPPGVDVDVVFPTGLVLEKDKFVVSCGIKDFWSEVWTWPRAAVSGISG